MKNKTKNYLIGIGYVAYTTAILTCMMKAMGAATYWCSSFEELKDKCHEPLVWPWMVTLVILLGLGVGHFRNSDLY